MIKTVVLAEIEGGERLKSDNGLSVESDRLLLRVVSKDTMTMRIRSDQSVTAVERVDRSNDGARDSRAPLVASLRQARRACAT